MPRPDWAPLSWGRLSRARLAWVGAILLLLAAPPLAKLHLLLGVLDADPALVHAGLETGLVPGPFPGAATIDPNIGFTSQALGAAAARAVLSGRLPWWNGDEGVGVPLAGEMQSAALFPPTWLLALPGGQLLMHLLLQQIAGVATLLLLRALGCGTVAAAAGALAFAFNGSFAWLGNAVVNPIAFLPVTLLGVEALRARAASGRPGGGALLTLGLAASLYAGFPEVAYLDGVLALVWALVAAAGLGVARWCFLRRVVAGGLAALAIAAPLLVAFLGFLPHAELGSHGDGGLALAHMDARHALALFFPYAFGALHLQAPDFWGNVGGYAGCALPVLALCGLVGARRRGLRIALAAWVAGSAVLTFGSPGAGPLAAVLPFSGLLALYRYLAPSWELALCVLAALALADMAAEPGRAWRRCILLALGVVAAACASAYWAMPGPDILPRGRLALLGVVLGAGVLAALGVAGLGRGRPRALALVLAIEAGLWFVPPSWAHPRGGQLERGAVEYLRAQPGLHRFVTLGPLQPNYASAWGLAGINHNDLPVPAMWTAYVARHLDANAPAILFTGIARRDPDGPSAAAELVRNLAAHAHIGVRHVLAPADDAAMLQALAAAELTEVFRDRRSVVFRVADAAAYFQAPGCRLTAATRDAVLAACDAPATLTRLELDLPGWHAGIGDAALPIRRTGEIFQSVRLPAGRSAVRFDYAPPYIGIGFALFALGWVQLAAACWRGRRGGPRAPGRPAENKLP